MHQNGVHGSLPSCDIIFLNTAIILWFDLGLIAREGLSNVSYSVLYNILKVLRWWYTPAIMIFMTFFIVKYLAKGAGTEAK